MKRLIAALLFVLVLPGSAAALETKDLVALAAMPLAVAAVADLADVPTRDLIDVVAAMNRAAVPAPQFIEVVRYVPVALVDESEPRFVTYVTSSVDDGLTGTSLALALQDRIRTYGVTDIDVVNPPTLSVVHRGEFIPLIVTTRVAEIRRGHPHGGPPGQLKKDLGVQTGAEIVHGSKPGRDNRPRAVVTDSSRRRPVVVRDDDRGKPAKVKVKRDRVDAPKVQKNRGRDRVKVDAPPSASMPKHQASPGGNKGQAGAPAKPGKGKGKGKGQ